MLSSIVIFLPPFKVLYHGTTYRAVQFTSTPPSWSFLGNQLLTGLSGFSYGIYRVT